MSQLRRTLRAELLREFMLEDGTSSVRTTTLGFERVPGQRLDGRILFRAIPFRTCRPFRLVVDEPRSGWFVSDAKVGASSVFPHGSPVPAAAFTPLPPFLDTLTADAGEDLRKRVGALLSEVPVSNIDALTMQPGVHAEVYLLADGYVSGDPVPAVWMLAHVPDER